MGCYEEEMKLVEAGLAERGKACRDYFAEYDAAAPDEMSIHRPDYTNTLFAPENDDIYQEFCRYLDQDEPRCYDTVPAPMEIEGYTAADIYYNMRTNNKRQVRLDAAAVYAMMVRLRRDPEIAKKVIGFKSTCYQCGTGAGCA